MLGKVIVPGLLGAVVLIVWTFVVNGLLGFRSRMEMRPVPEERAVHEFLSARIAEPGGYVANPAVTADGRFPAGQPVFSIRYSGIGHDAAGREMLLGLVAFLAAPLIGAWMLSGASESVLASFPRKLLFFVAIGLLAALIADVPRYGIAGRTMADTLLFMTYDIVAWTLVGLVVAWRMRPGASVVTA